MVTFVFALIIIVICVMMFGKADTKRTILNGVGLDLSEQAYKSTKEKEFAKYCIKAMKVAIQEYKVTGNNEKDFLLKLNKVLSTSTVGNVRFITTGYDFENNPILEQVANYDLEVSNHYVRFDCRVIRRRLEDLEAPEKSLIMATCDYKNKEDLKKYIIKLWSKYQYPWPDNWMQIDND